MKIRVYYLACSDLPYQDESILFVSKEFGILEYFNLAGYESLKDISSLHFKDWKAFKSGFTDFDKYHKLIYLGTL
jgi:hypothetical protein